MEFGVIKENNKYMKDDESIDTNLISEYGKS